MDTLNQIVAREDLITSEHDSDPGLTSEFPLKFPTQPRSILPPPPTPSFLWRDTCSHAKHLIFICGNFQAKYVFEAFHCPYSRHKEFSI